MYTRVKQCIITMTLSKTNKLINVFISVVLNNSVPCSQVCVLGLSISLGFLRCSVMWNPRERL